MDGLNVDVLGNIFFCFVEAVDVCYARQLSQKCKKAAEQNSVWQHFIARDFCDAVMSLQDLKESDILPEAQELCLFFEYYKALCALQKSKLKMKLEKNLAVEWDKDKWSTRSYECGSNHKYHLIGCALRGNVEELRTLLKALSDPTSVINTPNYYEWWAYYGNFSGGCDGYITYQKEHYRVNKHSGELGTVLHWACISGHLDVVKLLVEEFNADTHAIIDGLEVDAHGIAEKNGHYGVCAFLKHAVANQKKKPEETQQ